MLNDVGDVADHTGDQHLAVQESHVVPDPPFMLVSGIGHLDQVSARVDLEHDVDQLDRLDIADVGRVEAPPTDVVADPLLRETRNAWLRISDARLGPAPIVLEPSPAEPSGRTSTE